MRATVRIAAVVALVALTAAAPAARAEIRSLVNTGHRGPVLDLQYDETRKLLFSAGQDGTVKIWDGREGSLLRSFHVTPHAAQMIAVNPAAPQVAVIAADGLRTFSLSIWDWEQEKQVARIPFTEAPLFLRYSAQGSYLVYGVSAWQGLRIVDAATGNEVKFHPEGFGLVAFAEVSRSEKTIMTYQVSGRISYWDIASGDLLKEVATAPYLSRVRISPDRSFLVGSTGREAVLVDALSGAVRGRAAVNGDTALDISPNGDVIAGVPTAGGSLIQWAVLDNSLSRRAARIPVVSREPGQASSLSGSAFQVLCFGSEGLYLGATDGSLTRISDDGEQRSFGQDALAGITAVDATRGLFAVGGADWIRVFSSDLFTGSAEPTYVRSLLFENPLKSAVGLAFLSETTLIAWSKDDKPPRFAVLSLPSPFPQRRESSSLASSAGFQLAPSGFRAPLLDLAPLDGELLGIETGGTVRVVDLATGASRFEARVPSLATIIRTSAAELVGGRNTALATSGSLVRINTSTGETVGISGRNVFTWDLVFDPAGLATGGATLYAIGVDGGGATTLVSYDGPGFEKETVIASEPEEDLDAGLALDPGTHTLFATLGRARIVAWDGASAQSLPSALVTSKRLLARDGLLFSLNSDSTISISDQSTGAGIADLSLFTDGEWAAIAREGGYLASPGGDARVKVFQGDSLVDAREDYRLRVESW